MHSLRVSSGELGRRFIRNLLPWCWTFLQLQHHRSMSKDYFQSVDSFVVFRTQKSVRFWAVCGPKFVKFCDNVGDPSHFSTPLPDCLCHVSFSRYSPLSVEVVEKPNKCKSFLVPIFFGRDAPTFLRHIVRVAYCWPFDKVWLSSVCWSPSAKPGNEVECGIYIGWVKMQVKFEAVCGPKFMTFWDDVGDTL